MGRVISVIAIVISVFSLSTVRELLAYTIPFKYPHRKKSTGDKSEDLGSHDPFRKVMVIEKLLQKMHSFIQYVELSCCSFTDLLEHIELWDDVFTVCSFHEENGPHQITTCYFPPHRYFECRCSLKTWTFCWLFPIVLTNDRNWGGTMLCHWRKPYQALQFHFLQQMN